MPTSGTYSFNPALGDLGLTAFQRIGVRPAELTQSHMHELKNAANLTLSEWANLQPMLWEVGITTTVLVQGTATYTLNANIVMVLDLYISTGTPATDRILLPISRTDYASYPNKTQQGWPNVYWFDRQTTPTLTLWPVPDANGPYSMSYYAVRQTQDSNLANAENVEIPYRFLDAFVAALAWRLAQIYQPGAADTMLVLAKRAFDLATTQDVENVGINIRPQLSGYFR